VLSPKRHEVVCKQSTIDAYSRVPNVLCPPFAVIPERLTKQKQQSVVDRAAGVVANNSDAVSHKNIAAVFIVDALSPVRRRVPIVGDGCAEAVWCQHDAEEECATHDYSGARSLDTLD